jgi:glycosyltransferase involved in cell wall biosynthesis
MSLKVTFFRNFLKDRRLSMDVYADSLRDALCKYGAGRCNVKEYAPHLPHVLSYGIWSMRLARYTVYPLQARSHQTGINHIVDHGYGHLLYALDPARTVVTVHDLIPLVRWRGGIAGVSRGRKPWLNLFSFHALRRAGHLIAISENTRHDLIQLCKCKPENITVVYYGFEEMFRPFNAIEGAAARREWNMPNDGTCRILISGSGFYKNQIAALQAFARLRMLYNGSLQLIKIGPLNSEWTEIVHKLGLTNVSKCITHVSYKEMPAILNSVEVVLFPSLYEGFGRPPLEAMACGTPTIVSNAASLPEVVGKDSVMYAPDDVNGLANGMLRILTNSEIRDTVIESGMARAEQFTLKRMAQQTLEIYERVAHNSRTS